MLHKSTFMVIALSTAGVSAALLLYLLYKRNDDALIRREGRFRSECVVELPVPQECVSAVIGRGGRKINDIQNMTNTQIHFEEGNTACQFRLCSIRGTSEGVQLAKCLIESVVGNQPAVETYEMLVPHEAGGRIIGKHGMNIKSITRASGAKVTVVKSEDSANEPALLKLAIVGTVEQIHSAKLLIEQRVNEELELRRRVEESSKRRAPRRITSNASADSQSENNFPRVGQ